MKNLGIDMKDDDEEPEYNAADEPFYSEEINDSYNFNSGKVKLGDDFKKDNIEFDKLLAECESKLNTKTHILKL